MVRRGTGDRNRGDTGLTATAELRLAERALKEHWPITNEIREDVVRRAQEVLARDDASVGQIVAAGRLLALADSLNVKRETNAVREATPATTINIFGDVSQYAGVFGEPSPDATPIELNGAPAAPEPKEGQNPVEPIQTPPAQS